MRCLGKTLWPATSGYLAELSKLQVVVLAGRKVMKQASQTEAASASASKGGTQGLCIHDNDAG
jgi:hypothetical protein